jgi:hypothetical protein
VLRSEEFDNASWTQNNITVSANNIVAPNGTTTAEKITETVANNEHNALQAVTVASSTAYTLTCYAKKGERNFLALSPTAPGVANYYTWFNLDIGTIGTNASGNTATITNVGNGWYRCSVSRATGASQTTINVKLGISNTDPTSSYTGDGTSGIYIWGAQLEASSAVTPYIPTTTAAVSVFESSWYNQAEGTVFAEGAISNTGNNRFVVGINNGTVNEEIGLYWTSGFATLVTDNGVTQGNSFGGSVTANARTLHAFGYKLNDMRGYGNGTALIAISTGTVPTTDRMNIGRRDDSSFWLNGTIKRLTFWPTRLSNTVLQQITQP